MNATTQQPLLVVGAGIAGVSAALEAAETGAEVVLVERDPSIGGRVVRNHNYFPKLCPPTCGMEINTQRLEANPRLRVLTATEVTQATKGGNGWSVTLTSAPKHVNEKCTLCGDCIKVCPAKVADPHNLGVGEVTAIRLPHPDAWPKLYTLNRDACPDGCTKCVDACTYKAIDLQAKPIDEQLDVSAVVVATGWQPYPIEKLTELGGGQFEDVIANVNMERMVSPNGPTGGKILKPSNGEPPKRVAFVQCAGSRDVNHLAYCSAVCCLASLKQAIYVTEQLPEAEVTIYYIDRRAPGRNEDMLTRVAKLDGVKLVKGKVGQITQDGGGLKLKLEDVEAGALVETETDMVVLATGMMPNLPSAKLPFDLKQDDDGFGVDNMDAGLIFAGVARRPEDVSASVRDATGAAAKAYAAGRRA
ncbi:MAG: CoB--CoM heterodisulfide reductase iron-sulfur subunit A family protein [Deltaproteobacteria bacterium]|nr:CoB--CoM heterodisulfide reductase iron-sulfur subunit A family protein [Deltaproteobacteria bacterium]